MAEIGAIGASFEPIAMSISPSANDAKPESKPITVGLTCWLWQSSRRRVIEQIAQATGVTLRFSQRVRGLHRVIDCQVSGPNVDRFIGEFARRC